MRKLCLSCNEIKHDRFFSIRNKERRYLNSYCKECMNARQKEWVKKNKDKYRMYQIKYHRERYQAERQEMKKK